MRDYLFVGTSTALDIDATLREACLLLVKRGYEGTPGDLTAWKLGKNNDGRPVRGIVDGDFCVELLFKEAPTYITVTQYETEFIPGYSIITDRLTVCVSVWTGAEPIFKLLTACVASAVALASGGRILDSERKWSSTDLNDAAEFMEKI